MAIQMRRGNDSYFDATKMESGEFASVSDTEKLYHSFSAGTAKEVAIMDDVEALVSEKIAGIEIPQPVVSHTELTERDAADQHPISAITGLQVALDGKQPTGNYLTSESDPTVPEWAKAATKPTYTAEEVHALPDTTAIPSLDGYATEEYVDNAIANGGVIVTATGESIVLTDSSDKALEGLVLYGKTTQDGTPSPDAPIPLVSAGDSGVVNVLLTSENMLVLTEQTGYISNVDGTISSGSAFLVSHYIPVGQESLYVVTPFYDSSNSRSYGLRVGMYDKNKAWISNVEIVSAKQKINPPANVAYIRMSVLKEWDTALYTEDTDEYESSNSQILNVQTPNGLPGVPVTSGGNYTDANGQQYVSDYKDYEREVYVQRCEKIESYNGETISTPYISTTADLTTGATVIYALAIPIETPLTADEIAAYKALHTNKPVTTVLNDGGAGMSVSYVADTKAYIDNKFAALEAAILSTGGNV